MDVDKFISAIEKVFGVYPDSLKNVVVQFMNKSIDPEFIGLVYVSILYNHKANFGVPCISTIRECIKSSMKDGDLKSPYVTKGIKENKYNYMQEYLSNPEEYKPIGSLVDELAKKVSK